MKTKKQSSKSLIKNIFLFAILASAIVVTLSSNVDAKVFTIQNESVNMFVVNGTTGNILLNPNAGFGNVGIGTTSPQNRLEVIGATTLAGGVNASSLNVTGFSIADDSLVALSDGSKKKIKDIKAGEEVLTLEETTGKLVAMKVNALLDHGIKPIYEMTTKDGRSINTTAEHPYFVKSSLLGIGEDVKLPSSFNSIKNPSKSSGLDFSSSNLENALNNASGLSCGILSQTIPNIFSFGNFEESAKCLSLVINTLCSDLENAANLPLESPFGLDSMSTSCCFRNISNLLSIFSSERNLSWDTDNDIFFTPSQVCCILQSCSDMLLSQRRECLKNFFNTHSSSQHLQYLPDHDSCTLESGGSAADFAVRNNIFVDFYSHNADNDNSVYKTFDDPSELGRWIEVRYLKVGDEIAVPDYSTGTIKWSKISSIKTLEPQHVYDLSIEGTRNFIANDIVAHNAAEK